ncbi:hypothetical protein LJR225_002662 [Phenylobacterium sp. LjRoot225]|uniref:hypothetical protein n=1 Tax=Phenylobacterium sp. LjRoot225 TaxID=3342285 RepID=UPI003ECE276B
MLFELPTWVTAHVEGLAYAYAIWNGDAEEQVIGWALAAVLALDIVLLHANPHLGVEIISVMIELGVGLSVALRSDKAWPLLYASAALACALTVFAQIIHPVSLWAYVTGKFVWYYLECLILVIGASRAAAERRRHAHLPAQPAAA